MYFCHCDSFRGETCPTCRADIDDAEDLRDHGDDGHDDAVADRYEARFMGAA